MTPTDSVAAARPRVEGERETQILDATLEVLSEVGYDRLTMDAVAAASKASKATLYRRWSSKGELVVDAMVRAKGAPCAVDVDNGGLRDDLIMSACHKSGLTDEVTPALFAGVVSALQHDEEFAAAFRERFLAPNIESSLAVFQRAKARGEIAQETDIELLASLMPAVALHRSFLLGMPVDEGVMTRIVDEVVMPAATRHTTDS